MNSQTIAACVRIIKTDSKDLSGFIFTLKSFMTPRSRAYVMSDKVYRVKKVSSDNCGVGRVSKKELRVRDRKKCLVITSWSNDWA